MPAVNERTYGDAEIHEIIERRLPEWWLEDGSIRRIFKTHSWKASLMVANTVGHLAEAAFHHPELMISYASVEIRLKNHDAGGITDKDFELAGKIEEVVGWQPGKAGGALTGPPDGARFGYIRYGE